MNVRTALTQTLAVGLLLAVPRTASACEPVTLCVLWEIDTSDGFAGDYVTESTTPAIGNRVTIIRPAPEPPLGMFLGDDGCTTFETQYAVGHKVVVYNEAVVAENTHVRAFADDEELQAGTTSVWEVDVGTIGDDDEIEATAEIDVGFLSNLMGISVATLDRLDNLSGSGLPLTPRRMFATRRGPHNATAAVGGVFIGDDAVRDRFVYGHEIGHWVQLAAGTYTTNYAYGTPPNYQQDPACRFSGVDEAGAVIGDGDVGMHGLRSGEFASGAMTEGFAHFVSTAVFNDPSETTAVFRYYKELSPTAHGGTSLDLVASNYLVVLPDGPIGGVNRWAQTQCPNDFGVTGVEISTELDYMRFFWDFLIAPGTQPEFWDVVDLIKFAQTDYPWTSTLVWDQLVNAVSDGNAGFDQYSNRFVGLEADHGLVND